MVRRFPAARMWAVALVLTLALGAVTAPGRVQAEQWSPPTTINPGAGIDNGNPYVGVVVGVPGSPGGGSGGSGGASFGGGGGGLDCGAVLANPGSYTQGDVLACQGIPYVEWNGRYFTCEFVNYWTTVVPPERWGEERVLLDLCNGTGGGAVEEVSLEDQIQGCLDGDTKPVDVPEPGVGVNPALGLTGLETYFWAVNYRDNEPVYGEVHLGTFCGLDVVVETRLVPVYYYFSYGDGYYTDGTTSGVPWPVASEYRHVYERTGRYPVTVRVTLAFAWRLPGGTWQEAGQVTRASTIQYPVQQLQSVITR